VAPRAALLAIALVVAALGVLTGAPAASAACDNSWVNTGSGDWTDNGSWSQGHEPTAAENACITQSGTYTVTLGVAGGGDSSTVKSLTLGGTSGTQSLDVHGVALTGDTVLTATNGVLNNARGAITLSCQTAMSPCTGGAVALRVGSGVVDNRGLITTTAQNSAQLLGNTINTGRLQIDDRTAVFGPGPATGPVTLTNEGAIGLANGSALSTDQTIANAAGGHIDATGTGGLRTTGTFNQGAGTTSGTPVRFTAGGRLNFTGPGVGAFQLENGTTNETGNLSPGQSVLIHEIGGVADPALAVAGSVTNAGLIGLDGDPASGPRLRGNVVNTGAIIVASPSARYESGALVNQGAIALTNGSALTTDQTITNAAGGHIDATGTGGLRTTGTFNQGAGTTSGTPVRFTAGGRLNFTGPGASAFQLENGTTNETGNVATGQSILVHAIDGLASPELDAATSFTNAGTIATDCVTATGASPCAGGTALLRVAPGTLTNAGVLNLGGQGSAVRVEGSVLNTGTVNVTNPDAGTGDLANRGTLKVAHPPALKGDRGLRVDGSFSQSSRATAFFDVDPHGFSLIHVTKKATLGGKLRIATASGAPNPAVRRIVSAPTLAGAFSSMLYAGRLYALLYDDKGAFVSPTATPALGRVIGAGRVSRSVKVRLAGTRRSVAVSVAKAIPVGSEVDASSGTVSVTSALGATGARTGNVQSAAFHGGRFTISQARHSRLTTATLSGPALASCPKGRAAATAARRKSARRPTRRLFGSGKGAFTTKGHYGSATIRGTSWEVQDFCDSTRFTDVHGSVVVRDLVKRRTVTLKTGQSYTALARG
jgi:hypothetical protein